MKPKHNRNKNREFDKRIGCLRLIFVVIISLLITHLFIIQILDVKKFRNKAKNQRTSKLIALRGDIVDRNNMKLAGDKISYDIFAIKKDFDHEPRELAEILSPHLGIPVDKLTKKLSSKNKVILLKKDVDRKTSNAIMKLGLREISRDLKNKRVYPQETLASHVLGFYNPNADIAAGIEQTAKDRLEYVDKNLRYEKSRRGDIIYGIGTDPAKLSELLKGSTLQLTLNSAVQHVCEKALAKMVIKSRAKRGAVIVMEPSTGDILALAIYPFYNPNQYSKYSMTQMKNWAITDIYPPGSTFKILTLASGLINKKINKNTKVLDTGKVDIGDWHITNSDYKKNPYPGLIDLVYLLKHSSNVGAIRVALMMSDEEFYNTLRSFNIGQKTGLDLPGESSGLLPSPDEKKWGLAKKASMGYGYGASATAIQMTAAVNAIANKGVWVTPHVIKYTPEEAEQKVAKRRVMEEADAKTLTDLLVKAIDGGKSKIDGYSLAAKTGTSRRYDDNKNSFTKYYYTSMIGFLPASNPKVTIYVVIDSAQGENIYGSTVAGPVFREIALDLIKVLNINPDR